MFGRLLVILMICLSAVSAHAITFDASFNDASAQGGLALNLSEDEYGATRADARLLYNDREETLLGSVGLAFLGEPGNIPGLEVGVGGRLTGGETDDDQDLVALGWGGEFSWAPPTLGGLGLAGRIYYAPEIFAWLDSERLLECGVRLSYAITPRASLHLEYQNIRSDFEDHGNWTIDDDLRVGFMARF